MHQGAPCKGEEYWGNPSIIRERGREKLTQKGRFRLILECAAVVQEGNIRKTKSLPLRGPLTVHKATGGHGFPYVTLLNPYIVTKIK